MSFNNSTGRKPFDEWWRRFSWRQIATQTTRAAGHYLLVTSTPLLSPYDGQFTQQHVVASNHSGHANIPVEFKPHWVGFIHFTEITLPMLKRFVASNMDKIKRDGKKVHGDYCVPCVPQGYGHSSTVTDKQGHTLRCPAPLLR